MRKYYELTDHGKARRLRKLVQKALVYYPLTVTRIRLLSNETNGIFRLDTVDGGRYVLRVALPDSGHDADHYTFEMAWLALLQQQHDLTVPVPVQTTSGDYVVTVSDEHVPHARHCCIFSWLPGSELADYRSPRTFEQFGRLSAQLHQVGTTLIPPAAGQLPVYDSVFPFAENNVLFDDDNQQYFTDEQLKIIERAVTKVEDDVNALYQSSNVVPIVHGDLHQWNVLIHRNQLYPIDFEDMMRAFPIQDIGVTLYYNRHDDTYQELLAAFKRGYETIATFPERYPGELETHMLIRRIGLLNFVLAAEEIDISEAPELIPRTLNRIRYLEDHIW